MDERDYALLLELNATRNITHVARKFLMTQPALSKRILKIEEELGCQVLVRSNKGITLTPAGEAIIPTVRAILDKARLLREQCITAQQELCGTLDLGISIDFANFRLPKILKQFTTLYPRVDVRIITDKSRYLYQKLKNGTVTVAVLRGDYEWHDGKRLLSNEPVCLVCSAGNRGRPLNEYPYIGRHTDPAFMQDIYRWKKEHGLSNENIRLWFDTVVTCKEMVRCGLGWCILPAICLDDFNGYREELTFADGTPFMRTTYAMYTSPYDQLPQVKAFLEMLK